jgi:CRP-like cAMP-binding protein
MPVLPSSLRPFPSLRILSDVDLAALSKTLEATNFRAGSQICREGDSGDACYFLIDGRATVSKRLEDGRRIFLAELEPGAIFGQGALVPDRPRSADVRARDNVRVLALRRLDHQWGLDQQASWAIVLQKLICVNVVRQLRSALDHLGGLASAEHPELFEQSLPEPVAVGTEVVSQATESDDLPVLPAPPLESHDASTTGRLLTLLAETEASLATDGIDLGSVQFVADSDSTRRLHVRKG